MQWDGDPLFFPIDEAASALPGLRDYATIPPAFGLPYTPEPGARLHNFYFTTESRFVFRYDAEQLFKISILTDDEAWVFVNGHLAIAALSLQGGSISIDLYDAQTQYGLVHGEAFEMAVFLVERGPGGSVLSLQVSGVTPQATECVLDPDAL